MSKYEEKQQAKRERFAERAAKKRAEATSAYTSQRQILDGIPMGQPILVGHHSERRHRRDLDRIDRKMRQSIDATKEAARLEAKAAGYGTHGISADDPAAVVKLRAKIARLEAHRERYKAHNKRVRKEGGEPIEGYVLTNLGANVRRLKKRLAELETATARPESEPIVGDGFRIEECREDNRIRFYFDERPTRDVCKAMKSAGFRWARSVGAWQRQLNEGGIYAAKRMARELFWDQEERCGTCDGSGEQTLPSGAVQDCEECN